MDKVIEKIIIGSQLSNKFKNFLLNLLDNYSDHNYRYISIGDAYNLVKDLYSLEKDLINSDFSEETYISFIYTYAKNFCLKEKNNIIVWEKFYKKLIKNTLFNSNNRRFFLELKDSETGIVDFIKRIAILIEELDILMKNNQNYLALKKYKEIIELCNIQGFDPNLLHNVNYKKLEEALEKRYSIYSPMRNLTTYLNQIKKRDLIEEDFVYVKNPNTESVMVQKLLHNVMQKYSESTGYFLKTFTRDIDLYYLNNLIVVSYRYDDVPKMILKKGQLELNWHDRDFWAKIFDSNVDYIEESSINYFIESDGTSEVYQVISTEFQKEIYKKLGSNVIYVPEKYLDEGIYKYLNKYDPNNKLLHSLKIDDNQNNLMTTDYKYYFKDPSIIDDLEVENLEEYKYLNLIKTKNDNKSRNKSIASIIAHSKKNPKELEIENKKSNYQKKLSYKSNEIKWLPYKDD